MRQIYYEFPEETALEVLKEDGCEPDNCVFGGVSITTAKNLLRHYGGTA